jgi:antagonist of KipI
MKIIKPGIFATIQDTGRNGYRDIGVMKSGAMDLFAHRMANMLVGNDEDASTIEFAGDYKLKFEEDAIIAVTGAGSEIFMNDDQVPLWRPIFISAETTFTARSSPTGMRTYLSIAGGWDVKKILNSFSTHVTAIFGGYGGRPLKKGDSIQNRKNLSALTQKIYSSLKSSRHFKAAEWTISPKDLPFYSSHPTIRMMKGSEFSWMNEASISALVSTPFEVTSDSNRNGYRLRGKKLVQKEKKSLISTAVTQGTIQLTPEGSLLLLLADAQTTGGYPRIAQVAAVDLPLIAQLRPADKMKFTEISFRGAEKLFLESEKNLEYIRESIVLHFS